MRFPAPVVSAEILARLKGIAVGFENGVPARNTYSLDPDVLGDKLYSKCLKGSGYICQDIIRTFRPLTRAGIKSRDTRVVTGYRALAYDYINLGS